MRAGDLDQPIEFYRPVSVPDGRGGYSYEPQKYDADWAYVSTGSGGETEDHDRKESRNRATFKIRFRDDLKATDLILFGGVFYNILYLPSIPDRSMYMDIDAERGVAQ